MGYTFTIGNAVPVHTKDDFPALYAKWEVEKLALSEAPSFEGDPTGNSNMRSPSYSVWADFCRATGLTDLFYDDRGNLHAGHPGCIGITQDDANLVANALKNYRDKSTLPPGFEKSWDYSGTPNFDYHLARLIWLEFWMQWALKNCETPAIQNT